MENLDAEVGSDVVLQTDWIILEEEVPDRACNINFLVSYIKSFYCPFVSSEVYSFHIKF